MKKLTTILLITSLFACSEIKTPVETESNITTTQSLSKWYPLFSDEGSFHKTISVSEEIDGAAGGSIIFEDTFENGAHLNYKLQFARGAFEGIRTISVVLDGNSFTGDYYPAGDFNIPAVLTIKVNNADLSSITDQQDIKFVYMNKNGELEEMDHSKLIVNFNADVLGLVNAEIPHFSRYGFTR